MSIYQGAALVDLILADDEADNLDVAEMSLVCFGFDEERIVRVDCGEDVIARVEAAQEQRAGPPLVVILDLNMPPGMGGAEAAEALRSRMDEFVRKPMLICCAAGKVGDLKAQSFANHFDDFCTKPFTPSVAQELNSSIERWCATYSFTLTF
eukprot:CAMPEP_0204349384 /NCGR_PEP_ID=MMETSP0469-20131031/29481_1 /ASSEMBLY_ACC=CAM_ASM_000384 /TAXON_ID=2969 /ORGANISM="Oxyrrhis marina" /LENGTH=151 /DNA_ID=CAMNT_0051335563 /DNA_START=12 /DNA_END=467 /DNA_ORIENTATION=-